jgi:hypothetical protein
MIAIRLEITPPGATVEVGGVATTENPLRFPRSDEPVTVVASAPGYTPQSRDVRPVADGVLRIDLEPTPERPTRLRRTPPRLPDSPL